MSTRSGGMPEVLNSLFLYRVHTFSVAMFQFSYFERKIILVAYIM